MKLLAHSCLLTALTLVATQAATPDPAQGHPDSTGWAALIKTDLSNAVYPAGIWTVEDGVFTASEDQAIWSMKDYENFVLDLEFKTAPGSNSGVIVYASDTDNWIPNSVELQIADDHADQWANSPRTWQCAAAFGHQAAYKSAVKKPGEWNRMTVWCQGPIITIVLNGEKVNSIDMRRFTSAKVNPDGSEVPSWLSKPMSSLPAKGKIGFQGKHAGAPIYFKNIRILEMH
ncbi:MAG: hypothetical protein RI897_2023 [Verrucomicrobiota bacterium]|jgi:hypothetical protein